MSRPSWLTFIAPGSSAALAASSSANSAAASQLARIAGRGSLQRAYDRRDSAQSGLRPWQRGLLAALGLQTADWASAPVSAQEDAAERAGVTDSFWMHLEPVHFVTGLDSLTLVPLSGAARTTQEERDLLHGLVADHLAELKLELRVLSNGAWLARADRVLDVATTCPEAAASGPLESSLPRGADGAPLRRLMTELQMLLHDHAVNIRRSRAGLPPINALWLWGSGRASAATFASTALLHSDEPYVRGLGSRHPGTLQVRPGSCEALLQASAPAQRSIAVVPVEDLVELESQWVAPLVAALAAGRLSRLDLVLDDWHLDVSRAGLRRFWRRSLPPAQWAA